MPALSTETPLGTVTLIEADGALVALDWGGSETDATPLLKEAKAQLAAYFSHDLTEFDLPLVPNVSETQKRFCEALSAIPFGETLTYGEIAEKTGLSAQAAGQCCGANPIAIIIPCHRVIGANGLGGFSARGGVETKVALLKHEGAASLLI
ncbi:MAG: methylated-DNA--[protein]-cysteine S-methyltransferase [Boseongicola sp.]|nr:methylated-DNA--[protein]-cysteine S-methyltransferase [Boseongicola sp.]MDD9979511.1 methylated-DNA--[protein]-cysteine S-methyltransferase [Boseongicola sp.]